jgi:hypothetical protein
MNLPAERKTTGMAVRTIMMVIILQALFLQISAQTTDTIVPVRKGAEEILQNIKINTFNGEGFNFFEDKFEGHFAGLDFGFNALVNEDYTGYETDFMKNKIFMSNSVNVNFFQKSFGLQTTRNNFGLITGVGLMMQDYRLDDSVTIVQNQNDEIEPKPVEISENQKSKLYNFSVLVPLLAEVQIPINNYRDRLYFSAGMYAAYRLGTYTKVKYKTDYRQKLKTTDDFSLSNFKYGIMARTGYRWINFYVMYELTPFFKEGKGPELFPLTFGFTIIRF